jgi:phage gpG-like protein
VVSILIEENASSFFLKKKPEYSSYKKNLTGTIISTPVSHPSRPMKML